MKTKFLVLAAVAMQEVKASGFTDFWENMWCDLGGIFNFADFACKSTQDWDTLIPSTQRTQNTGGYMLKTKVNTDSDTLKVQLQLTTPVPSSGNVIEMSFSTKYTKSGVDAYDSGLCIVPYWSSQSMDNYIYEANDLSTSAPLVQLTTTSQTF